MSNVSYVDLLVEAQEIVRDLAQIIESSPCIFCGAVCVACSQGNVVFHRPYCCHRRAQQWVAMRLQALAEGFTTAADRRRMIH